jgi:hypothetical protein
VPSSNSSPAHAAISARHAVANALRSFRRCRAELSSLRPPVRPPTRANPHVPPSLAPQNFLALCASGQYDHVLFHRNIPGFMIQTGDPTGTGKGGQSIWGKPFPDEIRSTLKVLFLPSLVVMYAHTTKH